MIAGNPVKSRVGVCVEAALTLNIWNGPLHSGSDCRQEARSRAPSFQFSDNIIQSLSGDTRQDRASDMDEEEDDVLVEEYASTTVSYFEADVTAVTDNSDKVSDAVADEDQSLTSLLTYYHHFFFCSFA